MKMAPKRAPQKQSFGGNKVAWFQLEWVCMVGSKPKRKRGSFNLDEYSRLLSLDNH